MTVAGVPLVFVWLGPRAPDHLEAALELALRCSGLDVVLVAPAEFSARVPVGCAFVALESFYDPARSIELRIGSDHRFRQGFWLRTSERFLVLDRYMEWAGLDVMMHAELDCLMFGVDELVAGLESSGRRGLFVPFDRPDRCIASLLHCNDRDALRDLAAFMTSGVEFANDMEMLAAFAGVEPASVTALPTIETILDPSLPAALPCPSVSPGEIDGIVDAASIGQWVAGIDPRNLGFGRLHLNHFVNPESIRDVARFRRMEVHGDGASLHIDGLTSTRLRLYSLHLHSKIHRSITTPDRMERLLRRSRRSRASIVSIAIGSQLRAGLDLSARVVGKVHRIIRPARPEIDA